MPKEFKMKHKKHEDEEEPEKKDDEIAEDDDDLESGLDDSEEGDF